jgi:CRP-like cAMP-binding protein
MRATENPQKHTVETFEKGEVLYELGDRGRTVFLIRKGVVKTGTATDVGREIIYHVRKDGDVVGELCVMGSVRRERAVAVEKTEAIAIRFDEIAEVLAGQPPVLRQVLVALCHGLAEAYDQVNRLAEDDILQGLIKVLRGLALKLGQPSGQLVEIDAHFTQEELSQMVGASRERVSTALTTLRRRGLVRYTGRGHLLLDVGRLERIDWGDRRSPTPAVLQP